MNARPTVALISINEAAYSETFIHYHRVCLDAKVLYFWQGVLPEKSDLGPVYTYRAHTRFFFGLRRLLRPGKLDDHERRLAEMLVGQNVDLILAEYGITGKAMVKISRHTGIPLLTYFHGFDAYSKGTLFFVNYKPLFRQASRIFASSRHMVGQLQKLGCPAAKIILNPCVPADEFFRVKNDSTNRTFLAVGRFVQKKAPTITIRAFAGVLKKYPDARLLMVGVGPLLKRCERLVDRLGISANVTFLGICTPAQIQELCAQVFAFVQHSRTAFNGDREATSISVNEAGASGLPLVATYHGGIPDAVTNEVTGLLVEEGDTRGMTRAMLRLLDDPALAARLGKAAHERVQEHFTLNIHCEKIEQVFQDVLAERGKVQAAGFSDRPDKEGRGQRFPMHRGVTLQAPDNFS